MAQPPPEHPGVVRRLNRREEEKTKTPTSKGSLEQFHRKKECLEVFNTILFLVMLLVASNILVSHHNVLPLLGNDIRSLPSLHDSFPRVFVVPIPSEYHQDLLYCDRLKDLVAECGSIHNCSSERQPAWYVKKEVDDPGASFKTSTSSRPFGKSLLKKIGLDMHFPYTPQHPATFQGEYDADIYFHRMVLGYIKRVHKPEDADLFYVPIYWVNRINCHKGAATEDGLRNLTNKFIDVVNYWMDRFSSTNAGSNFFTVAGGVCSCTVNSVFKSHGCNPLNSRPDLEVQLRVGSWETPIVDDYRKLHVTMPYMTNLHGVGNWSTTEVRKTLVFAAMKRRRGCVGCGLCSANDFNRNGPKCVPLCASLRPRLIDQMQEHRNATDVLLLARPKNAIHILQTMRHSTFCLQPAGDTLTRKSFYESILSGCIPVVFRNDDAFMKQMPFSSFIPYQELWYFIPENCVLNRECGRNHNTVVDVLREVPMDVIERRRQLMKQWGRRLAFSDHNGTVGGYNDLNNPDAFASTLQKAWHMAQSQGGKLKPLRRSDDLPILSERLIPGVEEEKLHQPDLSVLEDKPKFVNEDKMHKCPYPLLNSTKCAPAVFIGGAMKCGTNEAMYLLSLHPRARFSTCNPNNESCSAFTHQGTQHQDGKYSIWESQSLPLPENLEEIEARLPNTDGVSTMNFDKAPRYMEATKLPHLPKNMKMLMPETKMVFTVCDPAERLVSEFHHLQRHKMPWFAPKIRMPGSFPEFLEAATGKANICLTEDCNDIYLAKGEFVTQIRKWLEVYDASEILVLDMNEGLKEQAKKLLLFAGLPLEEYPWAELDSNHKAYQNKGYAGRQAAWKEYPNEMCTLSKYYADKNRDLAKLLNQQYPFGWKSTTAVGSLCK